MLRARLGGIRAALGWSAHLAQLCPTRRARVVMRIAVLRLILRRKLRRPPRPWIRLQLARDGRRFAFVVGELADLEALDETFLQGVYELDLPAEPRTILDLGSHVGATILFFHLRYPGARILGVEPDAENFERLTENTRGLGRVELIRAAVAASAGTARLNGDQSSMRGSIRPTQGAARSTIVDAVTLDGLRSHWHVDRADLMKIDIEGAEQEVLATVVDRSWLGTVVGELHPTMIPGTEGDFFALLGGRSVERRSDREDAVLFRAVETSS